MLKRNMHTILLLLTLLSTTIAGAVLSGVNPFKDPMMIYRGLIFSIPLMLILGIHELGHFIAARIHRVDVTPPYFIPAPSLIGTFGAFIKIRSPLPDKNALMDIGAAGPLAGIAVAIPVLIVGLLHSKVKMVNDMGGISLGSSLLFELFSRLIHGSIPDGYDLVLHPIAFAGWIGLLVTALNLIPVGQLDGGHIAYALFGSRYSGVSKVFPFLLIPMGFFWVGWLIWAFLLFFLGTGHPPPMDSYSDLTRSRRIVGYISLVVFVLAFTPVPVRV
jgi:membrane-associated protease RseP (regulator of RpoE activity)